MFLNRLIGKEKIAFLKLAYYVARIDNHLQDVEKKLISTFCFEMNIDDINFNEKTFSFIETLNTFESKRSQKIVMLELFSLIYADDLFGDEEKNIMETIGQVFKVSKSEMEIYQEWASDIVLVMEEGKSILE